ncbi:MAG: precorrin-3B synthase [Gordonia sp. (in: high G+C Gram-positive bacteria)]|uniref:precorrin-3B synthase n=1 Tax=Gordonia sp. (in: high G+C Gram-positive bacteria) TaxID=84139 RepID=UPI0039E71B2F
MNRPADRCPGVFATHAAADGHLARLRLPGGRIDPARLEALALAAETYGDGHLEFTGRANVQVRGIPAESVPDFADAMIAAGLAGSRTHDRVRNIVVSPLTGRLGGTPALWDAADRLHAALGEAAWSVDLSGRFWFGFDDGRGDVLARTPDVVAVWAGEHASDAVELVLAGRRSGRLVSLTDAPALMLDVARDFLARRTGAWRIGDLSDDEAADLHRGLAGLGRPGGAATGPDPVPGPRVGWFDQSDGRILLGAVTPFGRLSARQAQFAAAIGAPLIVTPDRELLITDLTEGVAETVVKVLAPMGFVFDAHSPWTRVGACTGSPGCAKSRADVRRLLADHVAGGGEFDGHEHWVGCERSCGAGPDAVVRVAGPGPVGLPGT